MKQFSVAIAGLGARGYDTYAKYQHKHPERMKITAIADTDGGKLERARKEFGVPEDMCFGSAEQMLSKGKLADCIFIATQDRQHLGHTKRALEAGYDILLEKPVSTEAGECIEILNKAKEAGKLVLVCHVLRYTTFYKTIKKLLDAGEIGDIAAINAVENVGYWHQAHSFVRGNWRRSDQSSPMILQKCCHDFDIIGWLVGSKCTEVNSYGSLKYFKTRNAPENSGAYCFDCGARKSCPYDAYKIYIENEATGVRHKGGDWPSNIVVPEPTEESVSEALKTSPYGRCVFRCDNDVVDNQIVSMRFENGATAVLTMTAFSEKNYREITVFGTLGEIRADQDSNIVVLNKFGGERAEYDIAELSEDLSGHGGGDNEMLTQFFTALESAGFDASSTIENSVISHAMAFAAERSRLQNGRVVLIEEIMKS